MNKYILKVMRYLDNPELFSVEEMRENDDDASYAAYAAYAADAANASAYTANASANASAYAANAAAYDYHANTARYWVNEYFKISGESKQDYINEVERLK